MLQRANLDRGQRREPSAAGLEAARWWRTDMCQVNCTSCAEAKERKAPSASFPWLQVTVSQLAFFPQTPLGAAFCLRRAEGKF